MTRLLLVLLLGLCPPLIAQTAQGLLVSNTQAGGYFDVSNVTGLAPQSITVEAWVTYDETTITPAGNAWPTLIRKNVAPGGEEYFLRVNAGSTANRVLTWKVVTAGGAVNASWNFAAGELSTLTHVAGVWDAVAGEARLVVNGATVATATGTGPLVDNGGAARIGGGDPSVPENWNGVIDEMRVWSVALTDAQIAASMFTQILTGANLVASWILEGDALDYTGNGHDGTLVQPATFTPVTLPQPTYQVNTGACSLDIEGVSSSIFAPGVVRRCPGQAVNLNLGGTPGPWDAVLTLGASAVPDTTGLLAPWRVNVDLTDPTVTFLNGLAFSAANPLPTATLPLATPVAALTIQLVVVDPSQPLALAFSSVVTLEPDSTGLSSTVPGPTSDDTPLGPIDVTAAPLFGSPVVFYNAVYTDLYVNPNGRVSFTAGDSDFSATVAEFLLDPPSLGVWSDLSPNVSGDRHRRRRLQQPPAREVGPGALLRPGRRHAGQLLRDRLRPDHDLLVAREPDRRDDQRRDRHPRGRVSGQPGPGPGDGPRSPGLHARGGTGRHGLGRHLRVRLRQHLWAPGWGSGWQWPRLPGREHHLPAERLGLRLVLPLRARGGSPGV
jgi:hypothetical protein